MIFKKTLGGLSYHDIPMVAAEGVHERVQSLIEKHIPYDKRRHLKVLDLGAGRGALSQRLQDLGFTDITAWEINEKNFIPRGIKVRSVDLNSDFPDQQKYNLIVAVEIVEHLENTFHFFRQVSKILSKDGLIILSTPNIESAVSRIDFFHRGVFRWFDDSAYSEWGHIQPISGWQLNKAVERAQLKILERSYNYNLTIYDGVRNFIKGLAALIFYPLMQGNKSGDINLWVINRAK